MRLLAEGAIAQMLSRTSTNLLAVFLAALLTCAAQLIHASTCEAARISDDEALHIAKRELSKRVKAFSEDAYKWRVLEEKCELRVEIEKVNDRATGRRSMLVLTRSGKVIRYVGGM
jgi:hypothetical protein